MLNSYIDRCCRSTFIRNTQKNLNQIRKQNVKCECGMCKMLSSRSLLQCAILLSTDYFNDRFRFLHPNSMISLLGNRERFLCTTGIAFPLYNLLLFILNFDDGCSIVHKYTTAFATDLTFYFGVSVKNKRIIYGGSQYNNWHVPGSWQVEEKKKALVKTKNLFEQ